MTARRAAGAERLDFELEWGHLKTRTN